MGIFPTPLIRQTTSFTCCAHDHFVGSCARPLRAKDALRPPACGPALAGSGRRFGHIFACDEDATSKNVKVKPALCETGRNYMLSRNQAFILLIFGFVTSAYSQEATDYFQDNTWNKNRRYPYSVVSGASEDKLQKNAATYHSLIWLAMRDEFKRSKRHDFPVKALKILANPNSDIRILSKTKNLAIIQHSVTLNAFDDITHGKTLWRYRNGYWRPVIWQGRHWKIDLLDLNNDKHLDVLAWGGCCGWTALTIYISGQNHELRQTQRLEFLSEPKLSGQAPCDSLILQHTRQDEARYGDPETPWRFDCKSLQFKKP